MFQIEQFKQLDQTNNHIEPNQPVYNLNAVTPRRKVRKMSMFEIFIKN